MAEELLSTEGLSRRFGALAALDAVSLSFRAGEVHAIIGPNGAGKSTLLDLLSGLRAPSAGRIRFKGRSIGGLAPFRISRLGIGRSFQTTNVFPGFSAGECVSIAAQSRLGSSMRFFAPAARRPGLAERASRALEQCGLSARAQVQAAALSYGEQRQLEIGMLLATEPELLLLDEPLAGMGHDEARAITDLLRRLSRERTLVLVEHDMEAVFSLAQTLTVLVDGRVLESGGVEQVRASRAVRQAYLGEEGA
ncbi:MAG: ABC transporter ATP-binding protein [Myxococcales bacterium]